jgi:hypothetical protein
LGAAATVERAGGQVGNVDVYIRPRVVSTRNLRRLKPVQTTSLDLNRQRTVREIFATAGQVFVRMPLLFLFLAGIVVVPYEVVVLLLAHGKDGLSAGAKLVVVLVGFALVLPTVSALEVQAVLMLGEGEHPRVTEVFRRALPVLPVVAAAEIIANIGIAIGLFCFVIPGVYLELRWAVVAQVAAVEHTDWPTAIRRSGELTRGNYGRILGLLLIVTVFTLIVSSFTGGHLGSAVIGIALAILVQSFATLLTSLLYFDLRARKSTPLA